MSVGNLITGGLGSQFLVTFGLGVPQATSTMRLSPQQTGAGRTGCALYRRSVAPSVLCPQQTGAGRTGGALYRNLLPFTLYVDPRLAVLLDADTDDSFIDPRQALLVV